MFVLTGIHAKTMLALFTAILQFVRAFIVFFEPWYIPDSSTKMLIGDITWHSNLVLTTNPNSNITKQICFFKNPA